MEPLSLQEYICALNPSVLPRVLRICSGVYFQGSVYEISGNECCLSTGDLLKIIAIKLQKVVCEDVEMGQTTELPLSFQGLFQPSPDPRPYTSLEELIQSKRRTQEAQPLCFISAADLAVERQVIPKAQPIFLQVRKDVVKIPSTLEVDVEDVTEEAQHVHFIKPLLLSEVLHMEEALPVQAEILEGPSSLGVFKNDWAPRLQKGQRIQIHGKGCAWKAGAGSTALLCTRCSSEEDEGEESEELVLPLTLGGSFVEEVCDSKKYSLEEVLEQLPLPCEVKVVAKDPSLTRDVLSSFSALRLEARVTEPFLVSSFCEEPGESFEVPPRWLDMSLFFTEEPVHPQPPSVDWSRVEELNEHFYYHLLKQLPGGSAPPPPRPPKTKEAVGKAGLRTAKGNSPEKVKVWRTMILTTTMK
ncbi:PREDICTED: protein THEMIS2 [Tinamus guttatus]|uniref:protein THEMIS2 n=1 Tax=Tinamus guttatus TaxID=94827 RepID=UPI00052EF5F0|nr:PREDICTED: protein THEMIS2 [Tinamus guttatus]